MALDPQLLWEVAAMSQEVQTHPFSVSCGATSRNDRKILAAVEITSKKT